MASLKELKNRIKSVKNTQKITKAMKMVAAAKLRRAREAAEAARPYAESMEKIVGSLAASASGNPEAPLLLKGTGREEVMLLIVATSDKGLCGAFNASIVRAAKKTLRSWRAQGKQVKIICIGKKGYEGLKGEFRAQIIERYTDIGRKKLAYAEADRVARKVLSLFEAGEFDQAHIVYNRFKSVISQEVTFQQLIPFSVARSSSLDNNSSKQPATSDVNLEYEYEPSQEAILETLLPRNIGVQIFKSLLENAASEQGARMSAMDNATRNSGEMIKKLNLQYNRSRQAAITKELIEIISGAEAV